MGKIIAWNMLSWLELTPEEFLRFRATGRQHRGCIIPQAATHSLLLLKMGEIIARNMLSWLELLINRYCCIWLVVYIVYTNDARSSIYQISRLTFTMHCITRTSAVYQNEYLTDRWTDVVCLGVCKGTHNFSSKSNTFYSTCKPDLICGGREVSGTPCWPLGSMNRNAKNGKTM